MATTTAPQGLKPVKRADHFRFLLCIFWYCICVSAFVSRYIHVAT